MVASYKRLIPCILIAGGKAVKWFDDKTVVSDDVISLAKYYSDHGADELIVFDLSDSDEEHDEAIDLMKRMNRIIRIPMIAGGNVKRQEDVEEDPVCRRQEGHPELFQAGQPEADGGRGKTVRERKDSRFPA